MLLVLKILLTPCLIWTATVLGRRHGPLASGVLIGLPLTAGPVALFLALEHGAAFAAATAGGVLTGLIALLAFAVTYGICAPRYGWLTSTVTGLIVYGAAVPALLLLDWPPIGSFLAIVATALMSLVALPWVPPRRQKTPAPRWDLPFRMCLATALVVAITGTASLMGPRVSGAIAPLPVYAGIMGAFTHCLDGGAAAVRFMRGVLLGSFGYAGFFLCLAWTLPGLGVPLAMVTAVGTATMVQLGALYIAAGLRRERHERWHCPCDGATERSLGEK